jgi:SpoVK/Ycf46/Vps4 family AAA+-type ATPase
MPGEAEREKIWHVQVHPTKTPLAPDVDFAALARRFAVSGGDIKNAVLKAAAAAAAEPGPDATKRIHQEHLVAAMEEVVAAKGVMQQSLFADGTSGGAVATADDRIVQALEASEARWRSTAVAAAGLGAFALLASLVALTVALLR